MLRRFKAVMQDKINAIVTRYLAGLGFVNYRKHFIYGPASRLHWEKSSSSTTIDAIFNTRSGEIFIGDTTVIGHGCMFLTGRHLYEDGRLKLPRSDQVPETGYDIRIGKGCWIASGSIILGGVTLGDHCIVYAGAVVTKSFPENSKVGGIPARSI